MLTNEEKINLYGKTGENLDIFISPFPLRLSWDLATRVRKIRCHNDMGPKLIKALSEILDTYGLEKIQELEIDVYSGCFNDRKIRGSETRLSMHAFGAAIDLNPAKNGMRTKTEDAQFSKPEYKKFVDIMERNGLYSFGRVHGNDWMHFSICKGN